MLESTDHPDGTKIVTKFFLGRPELGEKPTENMIRMLQEDNTVPQDYWATGEG